MAAPMRTVVKKYLNVILSTSNIKYIRSSKSLIFSNHPRCYNRFTAVNYATHPTCASYFHLITPEIDKRTLKEKQVLESCVDYDQLVSYRHQQAYRTVLINLSSAQNGKTLHTEFMRYGNIKVIYVFHNKETDKHYALIEFQSTQSVQQLFSKTTFGSDKNGPCVPMVTPFLRLQSRLQHISKTDLQSRCREAEVLQYLQTNTPSTKCTISEQMKAVHEAVSLDDLSSRLHFLLCITVEMQCRRVLPSCSVLPFGSSVNGLGKFNCDLDLVLDLGSNDEQKARHSHSGLSFRFKTKNSDERFLARRTLGMIGNLLAVFTPQCDNVVPILKARVPIIKFNHVDAGVECDLCLENWSGPAMSKILFMLSKVDDRFLTLSFIIRRWASDSGLTSSHPGPWLSNFMLNLLLVYYCQQLPEPILPRLDKMITRKDDQRVAVRYARSFSSEANTSSLEELLKGFFRFYSTFPFATQALSVNTPDYHVDDREDCGIYLQNPIDTELNVCKNVSINEAERFQTRCAEDYQYLISAHQNGHGLWELFALPPSKSISTPMYNVGPSESVEKLTVTDYLHDNDDVEEHVMK